MTSIQPELWVESPGEAVAFYEAAFAATVLHSVGQGDDVVAQLGVGDAAFWVAPTSAAMKRLSPRARLRGHRSWSLYGAPWSQSVAISGKSGRPSRPQKEAESVAHRLPPVAS